MRVSASYQIPSNMRDTINNCVAGLGLAGIAGGAIGPGADLVVIAPTWAAMTVTLAAQAGSAMNEATAKKLALAVATGAGGFTAGTKIAASIGGWLLALPTGGISLVACMAGNAALNAKFTQAYGRACARFFLQGQGITDIETIARIMMALMAVEFGIAHHSSHIVA